jgi:hypothetical protein
VQACIYLSVFLLSEHHAGLEQVFQSLSLRRNHVLNELKLYRQTLGERQTNSSSYTLSLVTRPSTRRGGPGRKCKLLAGPRNGSFRERLAGAVRRHRTAADQSFSRRVVASLSASTIDNDAPTGTFYASNRTKNTFRQIPYARRCLPRRALASRHCIKQLQGHVEGL